MFGETDPKIFENSYGVLRVCKYLGKPETRVIDAKWITDIVAMVPFKHIQKEVNYVEGKLYFAVERMCAASIKRTPQAEDNGVDEESQDI